MSRGDGLTTSIARAGRGCAGGLAAVGLLLILLGALLSSCTGAGPNR